MSLESGRRTAEQSASGDEALSHAAEQVLQGALDQDAFWTEAQAAAGIETDGEPAAGGGGRHARQASGAAASAADGVPAGKQAETRAYEEAVKKAFGGKRGMADVGLPALSFLVIYTATKDLSPALWASVAVAAVLTVIRLFRRETLQHAVSGLFGVLVCAGLAKFTGRPENYYLPGLLLNLGYGAACLISVLVRWPVVGLMLGPITGEMTMWRQVPGRMKAFMTATWILVAMFVARLAVQTPLWLAHRTTELGIARLIMGYPVYLAALYFCWQVIKQAPPPVKPLGAEAAGADADGDAASETAEG